MPRLLSIFLTAIALLPDTLFAATQIYVAPGGNDANPGTLAQPVATPQAAQVLVRNLITAGLTNPVEVIFTAGTYELSAPLELRPEDSGTGFNLLTNVVLPGPTKFFILIEKP